MTNTWAMWCAAGVAVTAAAVGRADTVLKGAPGTNPIPLPNVKVNGIANGSLTYTTPSGDTRTVPQADVQQLTVDGQPGFNAAEAAFAARVFPAAVDGYAAAVASSSAPAWLRVRAGQRLATVARVVVPPRYDAQVAAYAAVLGVDPAAAAGIRPAAPRANTPNLDAAQTAVTRALGSAASSSQKSALLTVQLEIARAQNDKAAVTRTLQQLVAAGGATPADQANLKLAAADVALDAKQYAGAESAIQQNRGLFADPGQQVEALFVLAQARDGLLPAAPSADARKDVALAYERVATFAAELPDRPHAAESLLRVAQLEEKLNDPAAATVVYQQLSTDRAYAAAPAAAEARTALARLKK